MVTNINTLHYITMASTRNNNVPSDYNMKQRQMDVTRDNILYTHAPNGPAYKDAFPELGIRPSYMGRDSLSHNSIDIESSLFGVGSTNLVQPQAAVTPQLKTLGSVSYFDRLQVIMPKNLDMDKNQRPFPVPQ